jgi:HD-GYP domain-containing protein (c-di-GMP phosphodiesterase class II)
MTTKRAYRPAHDSQWALAELHRCSGIQFDPEVVDAFVAALANVPGTDAWSPASRSR